MSARNALVELGMADSPVPSREAFERALDAYAHELAEKLRKESRGRLSGIGRIYYTHAADLIDPEISGD